jgi:HTH-type transcriptional repressor of NAD biosynthesis genes
MKKYKNSLVLGKFMPCTTGHKYLIDTAIENSEHTNVIISHNSSQSISGEIRFNCLKQIYKDNPNVSIYQFDDTGLPQHDNECETKDEFYAYWIPEINKLVSDLDVVFTSENYGDDFSRYLGVEHFLVDKDRIKFPVSGTDVRGNVFEKWGFLPDEVRPYFVKRVVLMGPESVGKSTLSKKLANYFDTNFVIEYGRIVYESNGNKVGIEDFIPISTGRQSLEDWSIKKSNKLLFCDTEDITTYLFMKMFCKEYEDEEKWFIDTITNQKRYDLYILMKPDCVGFQDGTRSFLDTRWEHYEEIKKELQKWKCNFVEIGGDWDERFNESVKIVKSTFNI